jgi:hypothetical protein
MQHFVAGEPVVLPQCTSLRLDLQYNKTVKTSKSTGNKTSKALTQSYTQKLIFALGLDNICQFLPKLNYLNVLLYKLKLR